MSNNPYNMKQHDEFLFECECKNVDYDLAKSFFEGLTLEDLLFGCTSFAKNGLYGRSYDLTYDESTTLLIRVNDAKYKNIGIGGYKFTQETCLDIINGVNNHEDLVKIAPFFTFEGINEAGLVYNINILPSNDLESYTVAEVETKEKLSSFMLGRFILDNFGSAKEAIEYVRDYCDIYSLGPLAVHFMISDPEGKTYILEFVEGKLSIIESNILANFYMTGAKFNVDGTIATSTTAEGNVTKVANVTPHAQGLERYNIVVENYDKLETIEDFFDTLHKIRFTNLYRDETNPVWYSDLADYADITVDAPLSELEELSQTVKKYFINPKREAIFNEEGKLCSSEQSVNQSVYDIENRILYVETQEQDGPHKFSI